MIGDGVPLTDPVQGGALLASADWVRAVITGTPAAIIATLAVAAVGFLMLQGRLPLRRGLIVVLGCFVIFGAGSIARELMIFGQAASGAAVDLPAVPTSASGPNPISAPPQPQVYDPYAGASVPVR